MLRETMRRENSSLSNRETTLNSANGHRVIFHNLNFRHKKRTMSLANDRQWCAVFVWRLNGKLLIRISFSSCSPFNLPALKSNVCERDFLFFYYIFVLNHNSLIIRQRIRNEFEIFFLYDRVIKHCTRD